eukprot:Skav236356  [mRNA]  locus=scaffold2008:48933:53508:+ [translate_table: standard]
MSSMPPDIDHALHSHDVLGARGCTGIGDRQTILVRCDKRSFTEGRLVVEVTQMAVEGYGFHEFWKDHIFVPRDEDLQKQTVLWKNMSHVPSINQTVWLRNVAEWDLGGINYVYDEGSFTMPLISNLESHQCIHLLEMFAGGFGGWRSAADFITSQLCMGTIRSIAIEHDVQAAMSYAITNHAGFHQSHEPLPPDFFAQHTGDWVLRDDVRSNKWKHATANIGIDMVTISAPCPPWTGANHSPGLSRDDGMLLLESILETRYFRPILLVIEQVSNFAVHPHRAIITRALHWIGYKIVFQRVLNTCDTLKTDRPRFFLVAARWTSDDVGFQRMTSGFLMTPLGDPVSSEQLLKYDELVRQLTEHPFDDFFWFPDVHEIPSSQPMGILATMISMPTQENDSQDEGTQDFRVLLKAIIRFERTHQVFWFEGNLPFHLLPRPWGSVYSPFTMDSSVVGDPSVELLHDMDRLDIERPDQEPELLMLLSEEQLTVMPIPRNMDVIDHPALQDIPAICDQHGLMGQKQKANSQLVVLPASLPGPEGAISPAIVLAAAQMCRQSWTWNPVNDTVLLGIHGDSIPRQTIATFWMSVLTDDALRILGRKVELRSTPSQFVLLFSPSRNHGVCPQMQFRRALSAIAVKILLNDVTKCEPADSIRVCLHWEDATVWDGSMPYDITVGSLTQILQFSLMPMRGSDVYRLVHKDRTLLGDANFAFMRESDEGIQHLQIMTGLVLRLQGGGGMSQSKNQQRAYQQSSLAAMMLEYGFELPWVSATVEKLMDKHGLAKIQIITSQPHGGTRIQQLISLCEESKIELPKGHKPSSQHPASGLPWKPVKRRNEGAQVDPTEFQLFPGFFSCADGAAPEHLTDIRPQSSGICLLSVQQAKPWLQAGQITSNDELAILIPGPLTVETKLPHETLRFPCYNRSQQMVLVSGTIVQMGTKVITWKKGDDHKIPTEDCTLMALTLHKEDFSEQQWLEITTKTIPTVQRILANDNVDHLQSIWGRSLRAGRAPTNAKLATSVQVHGMLPTAHLDAFLRKSGYNGVFCTPKTDNGRLSQQFKVLWSQADPTQAKCQAAQIQGCLGLVKGRNTIGFRVRADDYERGWAILHPGTAPPTKSEGTLMFKAMGLPFGVTSAVMKQWCEAYKWNACPVKALGPTGWLLRASDHPKEGLPMFNGSPILLQYLPDKMSTTAPVVLGPKGTAVMKLNKTEVDPFQNPSGDPWANFSGSQPSGPRSITGPTEQRLLAQDDKISSLQTEFHKLLKNQETMRAETQQQLGTLEQKTCERFVSMQHSMSKLEHEVDKSLRMSLKQNTELLDSRMQELRDLISKPRPPKRRNGGKDDEEELSEIDD